MTLSDPRHVYIETLGCQMNKADSELMLGLLQQEGFLPVLDATRADLVIINTCQIRENAEEKAYSYLGPWGKLKQQHPNIKIAMAGCVAQQTKEDVFKRAPYVDIVFGTQNIHELPQLVRRAFSGNEKQVVAVDRQKDKSTFDYFSDVTQVRESKISAWVTIIEGCDYFCTYCVVPYTRGRQISRAPESVLEEVKRLAEAGYKEVTLLGQTVDAYGKDFADRSYRLAELMADVNALEGIERIRFMTSHPLDLSDAIIEAIATLPKVMEYIHIPMQAGDDVILDRMRRGYTAAQYYELVDKLYDRIPGVAVTGDYIVGFPGETEAQFEQTLYSVSRSGIHFANTAAYSARRQTPAGIWEDRGEGQVPEPEKQRRLQLLNEVIRDQAMSIHQAYEGQVLDVLVEGKSKRNAERWTGRTRNNKVVNFSSPLPEAQLVGQTIPVAITQAYPFSLLGVHQLMPAPQQAGHFAVACS
ncbi:MAG: tRNA (N6-isopentenyl adenosine(37)-C2)-methylthiotransferase MiaB [Candidatus Melainabacteria bacterium]|nr:tRNA (N6-isopentenyl adenosine(37)-C2)-methylthiotransferase MiaB [Candidatus Melainabacteria bacterium]